MRVHEILLVDDNPADAALVREALGQSAHSSQLTHLQDAESAVAYLRSGTNSTTHPDLIMMDLNLPRKDGRALLAELKSDEALRRIPIVVFSTSQSERDISRSYELGANCYVTKPVELQGFFTAIRHILDFWYGCARLPQEELPHKENHERSSNPCPAH